MQRPYRAVHSFSIDRSISNPSDPPSMHQAALKAVGKKYKLLGEVEETAYEVSWFGIHVVCDIMIQLSHGFLKCCQGWARKEGDLHRAFVAFVKTRYRKNEGSRCGMFMINFIALQFCFVRISNPPCRHKESRILKLKKIVQMLYEDL